MYNFNYYVPTRIYFGKGQISHLAELKDYGSRVLLCYGGGSIRRNGIYDKAVSIMKEAGLTIDELPGVEPNPKIETVRKGAELCKQNGIDMVLAIGGGSTIDCAKMVAAAAKYDGDAWDLVRHGKRIQAALPIFSVLTLAATGSEMDEFSVISDMSKNEKWGTASDFFFPTMSVLDPTYTFTVSKKQTAAGTADMMSHTFENYFNFTEGADVQARFAEGLLRTMIKYGPIALAEPDNYDARANLMWAGSNAINGIIADGAQPNWCVHPMEHELSAFYDITHGQGLAILTPVWMEYVLSEKTAPKFAEYGRNVWDIREGSDMDIAKKAIGCTRTFLFDTMELPSTLREVGITEKTHFAVMAEKAAKGCVGCFVPLSAEDIQAIFDRAF
ncbi:MAG: iron-containing alcohol dehydrogenase [Lachnospiraceae bacterium]|jgi:alcohol dehydrogenase YqhD (iron-dependent ADH family)|nr:iron-containing alcohol dehydrogenase [Lachnospiraceae bacterium]MCI1327979.1 iron-containing alcohol dehydrogenase [Lachnospiraceae bacterium]